MGSASKVPRGPKELVDLTKSAVRAFERGEGDTVFECFLVATVKLRDVYEQRDYFLNALLAAANGDDYTAVEGRLTGSRMLSKGDGTAPGRNRFGRWRDDRRGGDGAEGAVGQLVG